MEPSSLRFYQLTSIVAFSINLAAARSLKNTIVVAGEPVELFCEHQTADSIQWSFRPVGGTYLHDKFFYSDSLSPGMNIKFNQLGPLIKEWTLMINSTSMSHAGTYTCNLQTTSLDKNYFDSEKFRAELNVISHDPECTSNSGESIEEGDTVWIQCQFEFRGNLIPYLECERKTTKERHLLEIVNVTKSGSNVSFSVSDLVDRTSHGGVYSCMVRFETPSNERKGKSSSDVTVVREPPDYNFTWIAPPLDVLYKPTIQDSTSNETVFHPGSNITCSADSNPSSSYMWMDSSGVVVANDSVLDIKESMISGTSQTFVCVARNVMKDNITRNASKPFIVFVRQKYSRSVFIDSPCMRTSICSLQTQRSSVSVEPEPVAGTHETPVSTHTELFSYTSILLFVAVVVIVAICLGTCIAWNVRTHRTWRDVKATHHAQSTTNEIIPYNPQDASAYSEIRIPDEDSNLRPRIYQRAGTYDEIVISDSSVAQKYGNAEQSTLGGGRYESLSHASNQANKSIGNEQSPLSTSPTGVNFVLPSAECDEINIYDEIYAEPILLDTNKYDCLTRENVEIVNELRSQSPINILRNTYQDYLELVPDDLEIRTVKSVQNSNQGFLEDRASSSNAKEYTVLRNSNRPEDRDSQPTFKPYEPLSEVTVDTANASRINSAVNLFHITDGSSPDYLDLVSDDNDIGTVESDFESIQVDTLKQTYSPLKSKEYTRLKHDTGSNA